MRVAQAGARLAALYEATGQPAKAAEWRTRLALDAAFPADPFAPAVDVSPRTP